MAQTEQAVNPPKLLLADDSVTIRKLVELTFADEGIAVTSATDSQSAMQKFVEIQPDIVLLDVGLPGTSGYQICEMIKQDEGTKDIPVLLLVGSFEPFDQTEAERVGADGFLTKPFQSIRDLVARVTDLLNERRGADASVPEAPIHDAPVREDSDIESLYRNSLEPAAAPGGFDAADDLLGDAGMDDDLIQTSSPGEVTPGIVPPIDIHEHEDADDAAKAGGDRETKEFDWSPSAVVANEPVVPQDQPAESVDVHDETPDQQPREPLKADFFGDRTEPFFAPPANSEPAQPQAESEPQPQPGGKPEGQSFPSWQAEIWSGQAPEPESEPQQQPAAPQEISPELIAAVAQRVIDRLSDRVVREIAKEAVPRIAEKLIREALADENKA